MSKLTISFLVGVFAGFIWMISIPAESPWQRMAIFVAIAIFCGTFTFLCYRRHNG